MARILAIDGSYRSGGITDQAVDTMVSFLRGAGEPVEIVRLRDQNIEFCRNCRACTQQEGSAAGQCVLPDDMRKLIERIESSDAYILAAPTNFGTVTAVY